MTVLVTGATGTVGRHVVGHVLGHGADVRCLTRNAERANLPGGVGIVEGDLAAPQSLGQVFHGVTAAHLICFAGDDYAPLEHAGEIAMMLADAGVQRVTVLKGEPQESAIEQAVRRTETEWTFLGPVEFMANMHSWADGVRAGVIEEAFVDVPSTVVHEADIAAVAAQVLCDGGHHGETLLITGPEALTVRERVSIIGEVTGAELDLVELSAAQIQKQWRSWGFSDDDIAYMLQMKTDSPEASRTPTDTVRRVTGSAPRTFRDWVSEHRAAFIG